MAIAPVDKVECVVDMCFQSKFEIGSFVAMYDRLLGRIPKVFVGTAQELLNKVDELTNGVETCFQYLSRELPPWRTKESLIALYKICLENEGVPGDRAVRAMEAALRCLSDDDDAGKCIGNDSDAEDAESEEEFPAEALRGLRGYLRLHQLGFWEDLASDLFADDGLADESESPADMTSEAEAGAEAVGQDCAPSNLALLLMGLQATLPQEHGCCPAPLLRDAWSTLVPSVAGSTMRRVKRLQDLEAYDQPSAL